MSRRKAARSLSREENLQGKPPGPGCKGQYDDVDTLEYFQYLTVPECRAIPKGILNRQESGKKQITLSLIMIVSTQIALFP